MQAWKRLRDEANGLLLFRVQVAKRLVVTYPLPNRSQNLTEDYAQVRSRLTVSNMRIVSMTADRNGSLLLVKKSEIKTDER